MSDQTRIRRFLILGKSGGTYYVNETDFSKEAISDLIKIIEKGRGDLIIREIHQISKENRAPKRDMAIYATALCARYHTQDWQKVRKNNEKFDQYLSKLQKAAFGLVPIVCRISTDLFMFLKYAEEISKQYNQKTGWGRMMRAAVSNWYFKRQPKTLAMQLTKYKNRCGYTHRDALRLCHADPNSSTLGEKSIFYDYLFNYAVKGNLEKSFNDPSDDQKIQSSDVAKFMEATLEASNLKVEDDQKCADLIRDFRKCFSLIKKL